jgi:hypothetical protein
LIKALSDREIKSFELANGVREGLSNWVLSVLMLSLLFSLSLSVSLSANAAYLFDVLFFDILS